MAENNAKTLEQARSRYGKPFAHEVKVGRIKPKSFVLQHLEALAPASQSPARVSQLKRR